MQLGNFIDIFLARYVSGNTPIIRSITCWVAEYGFLHGVFGWVVVLRAAALVVCTVRMVQSHGTIRTVHTTYTAALKTTTHPKTPCRKPYAATQHPMLLMMGVLPETCRAKNTPIKLPSCIKLAFHFIPVVVNQPKCDTINHTKTSVNPSAEQCHCASTRRDATRYYNWQQLATTHSGVILKGEINECPFTDPSDIRLYHLTSNWTDTLQTHVHKANGESDTVSISTVRAVCLSCTDNQLIGYLSRSQVFPYSTISNVYQPI